MYALWCDGETDGTWEETTLIRRGPLSSVRGHLQKNRHEQIADGHFPLTEQNATNSLRDFPSRVGQGKQTQENTSFLIPCEVQPCAECRIPERICAECRIRERGVVKSDPDTSFLIPCEEQRCAECRIQERIVNSDRDIWHSTLVPAQDNQMQDRGCYSAQIRKIKLKIVSGYTSILGPCRSVWIHADQDPERQHLLSILVIYLIALEEGEGTEEHINGSDLRRQCHEIFDFSFSTWISFPQAPDYTSTVSIFCRKFADIFAASLRPVAKLPLVSTTWWQSLPLMSFIPVLHFDLRISPWIFEKVRNSPIVIFRGLGEDDLRKKIWSKKSRDTVPLKVPSHQTRLAWKWLGRLSWLSKPRMVSTDFKTCVHFLNSKLRQYIANIVVVDVIRRFLMLFALRCIWLPFAVALKATSDPFASCKKLFDYRMQYSCIFADFVYFHAVPNPLLHTSERNLIPFRAKTKGGQGTLSNDVTCFHVTVTWNNPLPLRISLKTEKILWKYKKSVFVQIRAPAAMLSTESVNCMESSACCNTVGRT